MESPSPDSVIDQIVAGALNEQATKAPGLRQAHAKSHGCVYGEFTSAESVPDAFRVGIFSTPKTYPVWVRFSNGSGPLSQGQLQADTIPDGRGMALKLMGVEGEKVIEEEPESQDFVLLNTPFFFVRDAESYIRLGAIAAGQLPAESMAYEFGILQQIGSKKTLNPLEIQYWSATPFQLGNHAVKLSARPRILGDLTAPIPPSEHYLREAMVHTLTVEQRDIYFDFMVQLPPGDDPKWVDDPTLPWDESVSPYIPVATIKIPSQEFDTPERRQLDESLSFNPWHTLVVHQPLGSVNQARLKLYQAIARSRREHNHQAIAQPQPYQP